MSSDKDKDIEFIDGLIFKAPNENAPDYVLAKGSIKRAELLAWLSSREGEWVNFDLKEAKSGKLYASVDNWKPEGKRQDGPRSNPPQQREPVRTEPFPDDDIPF